MTLMQYACKISTDSQPQKVKYIRNIKLPNRQLTLEDITKYIKSGETFSFYEVEEEWWGSDTHMSITGYRKETKKEIEERVRKAESYNDNYEEFHKKHQKVKKGKNDYSSIVNQAEEPSELLRGE